MKVTLKEAKILYEDVKKNGLVKNKKTKITKTIETETIFSDGWEYTFLFNNGNIAKIEEYNKRELIEVYVE